ncbi:MAG TPA: serine/threonine-protein kinase [Kofleriaceae bacterium]|nr:serine/threonine-protein kinase [Kofleriaceae bacterium]
MTLFGGRYTLLRRLAVGGMAEIYLARQAARAGFEKLVILKRLRAEHAADPRIVQMFVDEARIGALLGHPNIVHVYDVGEHEGIPFIAMEHILGEELNELCRRGIAHKSFLPLEHAVELMRQAAMGMGYFHSRRGALDGAEAERPLEIVHLDISPSNLLVTQDGFLKIIDFGIASARGQRHRGDVLPGKLGYMSPEQAARKAVDRRSDIFSLGIVLYEITVGKRLFRGSARDVIARLTEGQIEPPTSVRRKFPAALEAIVMRALARSPDARYQNAYDLADDLEAFLQGAQLRSGPVRIARYLDALSQAAGGPRRPELLPEAETRGAAAAARDGGRGTLEAYAPAPAKEWEDAEQPEADVAAALGLDLAELRALRTPPPLPGGGEGEGEADATAPLDRIDPEELERPSAATIDDEDDDDDDVPAPGAVAAPAVPLPAAPAPLGGPMASPLAAGSGPGGPGAPDGEPGWLVVGPPPGSLLPYSPPPPGLAQRLPWILVGALGMAVMALLAYIVVGA